MISASAEDRKKIKINVKKRPDRCISVLIHYTIEDNFLNKKTVLFN
jgi:hypothetical protein